MARDLCRIAIFSIVAIPLQILAADLPASVAVRSPNDRIAIELSTSSTSSRPVFKVSYNTKTVLSESPLGIAFKDGGSLSNLAVLDVRRSTHDETYSIVAGKTSTARDHYNEAVVALGERDAGERRVDILLRAYDDGVALRYRLPEQPNLKNFAITEEETAFNIAPDATAWVLPLKEHAGHYEYYYRSQKLSSLKPNQLIGLPCVLQMPNDGPAVGITEANLNDYPGMCLSVSCISGRNLLCASLTPRPDENGIAVRAKTPFLSPWRIIQVADTPGQMIESNLVSNLSDPCVLKDTSWIHPGKVAFLWWNGYLVDNGRRGAVNTKTFLHYVDAAAEFGFPYCSIDGLDIAWYGDKLPGDGSHDITVPVDDLDIQKVLAHAKQKGVRIRLWLPAIAVRKYLDKALPVYESWGVEGLMIDFVQRDDQDEVNWLRDVVAKCADHHFTVSFHNIPKPTGLSRTYPNLLTYEAVLNQEYNKWSPGATAQHNVTVPFIRMLAGPLDYHAGGFRSVRPADFLPHDVGPEVPTTRCQQLAMYVVYEDPLPMAVDYPAAYRNRPGIEFLTAVPTTWDETRFIQGEVGEYITIARRKGAEWYVGSMTNDTARTLRIPLYFLPPGEYVAETWSDDPQNGPNALRKATAHVTSTDSIEAPLASTGGQVIWLHPAASVAPNEATAPHP
jgi:alpha-glucosidase